MECGIAKRNGVHECESEIQTFEVKRTIDGMEGHLTVCKNQMDRLVNLGEFKIK